MIDDNDNPLDLCTPIPPHAPDGGILFVDWRWYDWVVALALAGIGWGAVGAAAWLVWIELH